MNRKILKTGLMGARLFGLIVALAVTLQAQISDGTFSLPTRSETFGSCVMTDLAFSFINERSSTCAQGQSNFANGEVRWVRAGIPPWVFNPLTDTQNGFELTNCGCSSNEVWTRTMDLESLGSTTYIGWRWKFFGRNSSCGLQLKRDLLVIGCPHSLTLPGSELCPCSLSEGFVPVVTETGDCTCVYGSPIILDLDGNGINLTSRANGVLFDFDGDGKRGQIAWLEADSEDGWLVFDYYEDHNVPSGRHLLGDRSAQAPEKFAGEPKNGYRALRGFDDNGDGQITPEDGVWRLLAVWRDPNHNGLSDPGEVTSLTANGITSLSLDYKTSRRVDRYGNEFRFKAKVMRDGKERYSFDVFLSAK